MSSPGHDAGGRACPSSSGPGLPAPSSRTAYGSQPRAGGRDEGRGAAQAAAGPEGGQGGGAQQTDMARFGITMDESDLQQWM